LEIIVLDLDSVLFEGQQDLISDGHAVVGVTTAELLQDALWDLGRQ
jgi:hypothetical protein